MRECTDWRKSRRSGSKAFVIIAGERGGLVVFVKNAVSSREKRGPGPLGASKCFFRAASDGLAAHVKTRVYEDGTTSQLLDPAAMARKLLLMPRLAAIPVLLAFMGWLEARHPVPAFQLFTFFVAFLVFADLASLLRGKWRNGLVVLASLAFGLCVVEGVATLLEPKTLRNVTKGWSVGRPVIGWRPEHPGRFHAERRDPKTGAVIYLADYTIDANLLRQTASGEKGPAIVFFGDSFTFGDGVNDAETMPQAFADLLDRKERVLNLGFTGYGPQQFLRELETGFFDPVIGPRPRLFIFLTAAWHAERTACKEYWTPHAPLYALESGQIVFKGACNEGPSLWLREWLQNTASYRLMVEPLRHKLSHDDVDLYVRILLAAVSLAKEKYGVATLIPYLRLRASEDYLAGTGFSDDSIIARLREGGAIVIDASLADEEA
ncbi:MAG: SGNH/GDSL hydrolase family protein, partial [Methylocella sp.]